VLNVIDGRRAPIAVQKDRWIATIFVWDGLKANTAAGLIFA
jgi:hypothetical protein